VATDFTDDEEKSLSLMILENVLPTLQDMPIPIANVGMLGFLP